MKLVTFVAATILLSGCKGGGGGGSAGGDTDKNGDMISERYNDTTADPLAPYLWHLKNTGQANFSSTSGLSGTDINLSSTHNFYRGSGQTVVVSDGRIDIHHEDLVDNTIEEKSKNYAISNLSGESPTSDDDSDFHGTAVMGIIGASRGNGKGIYGIAPLAKYIGLNFLDSDQSLSKLQDQAIVTYNATYNFSYGFSTCQLQPVSKSYIDYLRFSGNRYVTSAGNDYSGNRTSCGGTAGVYLGNGNLDQVKSYPHFIVVAAVDANGEIAEYSTPSSNIWISAPGGMNYSAPGLPLLSTDLEGCNAGAANNSSKVDFDKNITGTNPNCAYATEGVAGTSFASPMIAGVVTLIKEACGFNCDRRKIKHILAVTAKKIKQSSGNTSHPLGADLAGHVYQNGWITNAAGFNFHNWFGFGLVDTEAAINLAKNNSIDLYNEKYTDTPTDPFYKSGNINLSIPDNSATGRSSTISVEKHNLVIEHVQIKININHTYSSDLGIELTSPSGTTSKLMSINSGLIGGNLTDLTLGSNAFYGEKTSGTWTLKVIDGFAGDTGTIVNWGLSIVGNKGQTTASTPGAVTNIGNAGNTIYWTPSSDPNLKRYEVCIKTEDSFGSCPAYSWFPIAPATAFAVTKFNVISWYNISPGTKYKFSIRAVDHNENESETVEHTWTAI
ncbi:MAG: S8 family serine peptidase [Bacteriovoracaceae bacterium]|nr:S8 family serine peptidase [Bacteriovoracaceae bacterium]